MFYCIGFLNYICRLIYYNFLSLKIRLFYLYKKLGIPDVNFKVNNNLKKTFSLEYISKQKKKLVQNMITSNSRDVNVP